MTLSRRNTITLLIIYGCTLKPTQVLGDRDAYLQEKYLLKQLENKKKKGFLFGRRKKRNDNNDPAVQYQRQQNRLSDTVFLLIAMFLACLAVLWLFGVSSIEMVIIWIGCICSQISDFTGSFVQQRTNETSRRKRDRKSSSNNNNRRKGSRTSRQRNSFNDNQSISPSVLEIIDMETAISDDSSSSPGVISKIFSSMTQAGNKFMSSSKLKDTPDKRHKDRSSSTHNQKSHKDKSSLRLRASSKQTAVRRRPSKDEELGDDELPSFLNFVEDDECSDNGTAFAVNSPMMSSPKREKHTNTRSHATGSAPTKKQDDNPLQKKLSCGSEDAKQHRSKRRHGSHQHSSRRHTKH